MLRRIRKNGTEKLQIMHAEFAIIWRRILTSLVIMSEACGVLVFNIPLDTL